MSALEHPANDPRTIDELVNAALIEPDEHTAWAAVGALHWRGTIDVVHRAASLCASACPQERCLGADILGQIGVPERTFPEEAAAILFDMLATETDPSVLRSIFIAFSHLHVPGVVNVASRYACHTDADVRHAVVLALTGYEDPVAVASLIKLTCDRATEVRDWATFGLGTISKLDTPEIRDALAARLDDPDEETRLEAMQGLAHRKDLRVVPALQRELELDPDSVMAIEAAEFMASPELLPALPCRVSAFPALL